ncbi:hypothetical protein AVEN_197072-1 [Araneus ventricosus]|uniref:Uncharacterized protein n=1 Tax=Araneus ventricosus TaxID=182803 RepID=A0A4Y2EWB1_ARAVE|nr:hypothetical protein AVEN_197072-1 [Araneus ventricosus]
MPRKLLTAQEDLEFLQNLDGSFLDDIDSELVILHPDPDALCGTEDVDDSSTRKIEETIYLQTFTSLSSIRSIAVMKKNHTFRSIAVLSTISDGMSEHQQQKGFLPIGKSVIPCLEAVFLNLGRYNEHIVTENAKDRTFKIQCG